MGELLETEPGDRSRSSYSSCIKQCWTSRQLQAGRLFEESSILGDEFGSAWVVPWTLLVYCYMLYFKILSAVISCSR